MVSFSAVGKEKVMCQSPGAEDSEPFKAGIFGDSSKCPPQSTPPNPPTLPFLLLHTAFRIDAPSLGAAQLAGVFQLLYGSALEKKRAWAIRQQNSCASASWRSNAPFFEGRAR